MDEISKLTKENQDLQKRVKYLEDVLFGFKDDNVFRAKILKAVSDDGGSASSLYIGIPRPEEIIISSGVISISQSYHTIETEGGASSDNVDTINDNGFRDVTILVLRAASSIRTVVLKDGTGNLRLAGDCTLDNNDDSITLIGTGAIWYELARSNNDT
jgi:hypothetical protein